MKETRYKADPRRPYGLHDSHITGMTFSGGNLKLTFEDEFTRFPEPCVPGADVRGFLVVEGADFDSCDVLIQGKGGSRGGFRGERLTIPEFTEAYQGFRFEVIDEYFGWQRLLFTGWLWMPGKHPKEMTLELGYFMGDVVYVTEE